VTIVAFLLIIVIVIAFWILINDNSHPNHPI